ncbi:MAG: rRNA maturation RNase YbeY [Patescibacteria group bacterium]
MHKALVQTDYDSAIPYIVGPVFFSDLNTSITKRTKLRGAVRRVSCQIVHDRQMKKLNTKWRGIPTSTDVLAFPYDESPSPGQGHEYVGEVIISIDRAKKQAQEQGHALRTEVAHLYTHGALHILGYDHVTPTEAQRMYALQALVVKDWQK